MYWNENHPARKHHWKEGMQRIEDKNPITGRIISGDTGTRMAMLVAHAFLGTRIIPWCVHGGRTPPFDFVMAGWDAKWKMVNPSFSPEQDGVAAVRDLGRLPSWSGKLLRKLVPAPRTKVAIERLPESFLVIEAAKTKLSTDEIEAVLKKSWEIHDSGTPLVVYTKDPVLASFLPEGSQVVGPLAEGQALAASDHALWFAALKTSRVYTISPENNLFAVHFVLAGIPREIIVVA